MSVTRFVFFESFDGVRAEDEKGEDIDPCGKSNPDVTELPDDVGFTQRSENNHSQQQETVAPDQRPFSLDGAVAA